MLEKVAGTGPVTLGGTCSSVRIFKLALFLYSRINRRLPQRLSVSSRYRCGFPVHLLSLVDPGRSRKRPAGLVCFLCPASAVRGRSRRRRAGHARIPYLHLLPWRAILGSL